VGVGGGTNGRPPMGGGGVWSYTFVSSKLQDFVLG